MAVLLGTVLIVLGMAAQMFQFHHYEQISDTEREVLKNVAVSLPDIANERDLLILDGSHRINSVWMLRENMMNALTYLYGKPINRVQICNQPENDWQRTDERGRTGQCAEYPDHWEFSSGATVDGPGYTSPPQSVLYRADKSTTQVVRIPENGIVPLLGARKDELSLRNDTVSRRYRAMLAPPPGCWRSISSATGTKRLASGGISAAGGTWTCLHPVEDGRMPSGNPKVPQNVLRFRGTWWRIRGFNSASNPLAGRIWFVERSGPLRPAYTLSSSPFQ
ncbi:hypothetical protein ACFQS6_11280 [Xanthomonas populi]